MLTLNMSISSEEDEDLFVDGGFDIETPKEDETTGSETHE